MSSTVLAGAVVGIEPVLKTSRPRGHPRGVEGDGQVGLRLEGHGVGPGIVPGGLTTPGGKPVTEEPGLAPRAPVMTEGPVMVTVDPPRTAKPSAVPRLTGEGAALAPPEEDDGGQG